MTIGGAKSENLLAIVNKKSETWNSQRSHILLIWSSKCENLENVCLSWGGIGSAAAATERSRVICIESDKV